MRRQQVSERLNEWVVFSEKNKELCEWLTQMESKVSQNGDILIEDMIQKLRKVWVPLVAKMERLIITVGYWHCDKSKLVIGGRGSYLFTTSFIILLEICVLQNIWKELAQHPRCEGLQFEPMPAAPAPVVDACWSPGRSHSLLIAWESRREWPRCLGFWIHVWDLEEAPAPGSA